MCILLRICIAKKPLRLFSLLTMFINNGCVFYAVGRGKKTGIYNSWGECKAQTDGFPSAKFQKFYSYEEAKNFVNHWENYSTSTGESDKFSNSRLDEGTTKGRESSKQQSNEKSPTPEMGAPQKKFSAQQPLPLPSQWSPDEREGVEKALDFAGVNRRLSSLEKKFEGCLKDIGWIMSEIHSLQSTMEELKGSSNSKSAKAKCCNQIKSESSEVQEPETDPSNTDHQSKSRPGKSEPDENELQDEPKVKRRKIRGGKLSRSSSTDSLSWESETLENVLAGAKEESVDLSSFTVDEKGFVVVYTDGSATGNGTKGAKAGIGVWFGDDHPLNVSQAVVGPATNSTAEIQAARVALQVAREHGIKKLKICTDSVFLINSATTWIPKWKKNGWKKSCGGPVKNKKELEKLDKAASSVRVLWVKVPAHSKVKGNEWADRLANLGAAKYET